MPPDTPPDSTSPDTSPTESDRLDSASPAGASDFSLPKSTRPGRVCLLVNDLDDLVDFYRDVVGLRLLSDGSGRATLGASEPLLELVEEPAAPARTPAEAGLFHVAFRVPSRAALGDALGRAREKWRLTGASDHLVSEALYLRDPEGNGIEVYRDRPRAEWPRDPDGTVSMDTLPLDLDDLAARAAGDSSLPPETDVGHVHLEVASLAAARAFYVDTLGLSVRDTFGDAALFVAAGDYHHHVGLNVWNGRSAARSGRGLVWFSLVVPDEATLAAVAARVEGATERGDLVIDLPDPAGVQLRVRTADV